MSGKIQAGLELIAVINADKLKPQELIDVLHNLITKDWTLIHKIITAAVEKKLIERDGQMYRLVSGVDGFEVRAPTIRSSKEQGVCSMCGKQIYTCYYADIGSRTYGPFGSTCSSKGRWIE